MSKETNPPICENTSENTLFDVSLDTWSQYSRAFQIANANTTQLFVKFAALQTTVCIFGIWLTRQSASHVLEVIGYFALIVFARFLCVLLKAYFFKKTRYCVKDAKLCAYGPIAEYNWQVPLERITHVQTLNSKSERPILQLSTSYSTHIIYGLSDSKSLLELFPQSIFQADFARLRVSLEECLDSVFESESEPGNCQRKQLLANAVLEALKEFPEAKLLVPNYQIAIQKMYLEMAAIVVMAGIACVATPETILWGIPLLLVGVRSYFLRIEKAASCLYVICADGLLELDYKRGLLNRIELHDLRLRNPKGDCWWLRFPGLLEIPMNQMDQAFARLKICVRDRQLKV